MKKCTSCNETDLSEFHIHLTTKDKLQPKCKACRRKASKTWDSNNKEHKKKLCKDWLVSNKASHNAKEAKYQAAKIHATPSWLTKGQLAEIKEWYKLAEELQWLSEEKLHVDHIVPLRGNNVSGLHVPWNLQILPLSINCSKSNKHE